MLFDEVALYYEKLESISSRLEMIDVLAELFGKASKEEIKALVYMTQGLLGPPFNSIETGIAEKYAQLSVEMSTGHNHSEIINFYHKSGDMGLVAEEFRKNTKLKRIEHTSHTVNDIHEKLIKISATNGQGSQDAKIKLLSSLISSSNPIGARYIMRLVLGQLRLGVGDATILEALSKNATGDRKLKPKLENAYNICSDLGNVAYVLATKGVPGIEHLGVILFSPIRPALAERLPTAEEILERTGGVCSVESKYDGMRVQAHFDKKNKKVRLFSRNLEVITEMFPDIAKALLEDTNCDNCILEGEAIAYDEVSGTFYPFQETVQRKRKHGIEEASKRLPVVLFAFDLLYCDGESYLNHSYSERRKKLSDVVGKGSVIKISEMITTDSPKELERYFASAIERGLEGIVAKDPRAPYIAGARKFSWIKMKRSYKSELSDSIDLVIIGYYFGKGQRAELGFGGLLAAVYNQKRDMFETITKIGTGFTEEQMKMFKSVLEKIHLKKKPARVDSLLEPDFWVEPKYVITVNADEITRSPMHTCGMASSAKTEESGYALRFPRLISDGIRKDKGPEETTTTEEIIEMFSQQKKTKV